MTEFLPPFTLLKPATVAEVVSMRRANEDAVYVAGGTDLLVNMRRGIGEHRTLIDLTGLAEIGDIMVLERGIKIGAGVKLAALAGHPEVAAAYPLIAQAAAAVAGPTHRGFATVGGNLCLDTRCIYYNQSHWWRQSNDYCLKYKGSKCHVAPKSKFCFAAFSGDLAPALIALDAEVELVGPAGTRRLPLCEIYRDDGMDYLKLGAGEFIAAVRVDRPSASRAMAYEKVRVRDAIDFPLAGVAVVLGRDGDTLDHLAIALTGTNSCPLRVTGLDTLIGKPFDEDMAETILRLVAKQIQPMKSTLTPSTYRRSVATRLAVALVRRLWQQTAG